jgi:hypothetical protein
MMVAPLASFSPSPDFMPDDGAEPHVSLARDNPCARAGEFAGVVAAPERLIGWAEIAKAGSEFVYATRAYLPNGSPGAKTARELAARGILHLKQRRIAGTPDFNYIAERSGAPWSVAPERPKPKNPHYRATSGEAEAINALYPILTRAAQFGRPCPTDVQMSERSGVEPIGVKLALNAMEQIGMIRIEPAKAPTLRFITIVATGHRTGLAA